MFSLLWHLSLNLLLKQWNLHHNNNLNLQFEIYWAIHHNFGIIYLGVSKLIWKISLRESKGLCFLDFHEKRRPFQVVCGSVQQPDKICIFHDKRLYICQYLLRKDAPKKISVYRRTSAGHDDFKSFECVIQQSISYPFLESCANSHAQNLTGILGEAVWVGGGLVFNTIFLYKKDITDFKKTKWDRNW